ncbi:MAG: histidinol-phosphatase [Armatimonas sp.]
MSVSPLPMDYHSHHWRCGHATGELLEYAEAAQAAGLRRFGMSDHNPAWWSSSEHPFPGTYMARAELPAYLDETRALQSLYKDTLELSVGLEVDWIEGREDDLARFLDSISLDYALGSVHYCGGKSIFDRRRWATDNPDEVFAAYYALVAKAACSGLFDILSHLTAVEAYAPPNTRKRAHKYYPGVADAVAEGGCLVEINTSGYRKMGEDEPFPNRTMLRLLIERGVGLTFGSDSHTPQEVTFGAARVAGLLEELGIATEVQQKQVRRGPLLQFCR